MRRIASFKSLFYTFFVVNSIFIGKISDIMFESRCGVLCDSCERKEQVSCTGCLTMEKTFWGGECGVKTCCEAKELGHCGECEIFPCEMLSNMGKEQGFDPLIKIEQCRIWANEEKI